jgi:type II secretory pathway component PulM
MNGIIRFALVFALSISSVLVLAMAQPAGEKTRSGQNLYQTQEAHDAVQDEKIKELEQSKTLEASTVADIRDKQNYILGGMAAFGFLLTGLHVISLRKIKG